MKICSYSGCTKPHLAKGLCSGHNRLRYEGKELRPLRCKAPRYKYVGCAVPGCEGKHHGQGLCTVHYVRALRFSLTPSQLVEVASARRCQLCGSDNGGATMSLDHDHACCTGKKSCGSCLRGLVCRTCNRLIAWYETGVLRLHVPALDDYLADPPLAARA